MIIEVISILAIATAIAAACIFIVIVLLSIVKSANDKFNGEQDENKPCRKKCYYNVANKCMYDKWNNQPPNKTNETTSCTSKIDVRT